MITWIRRKLFFKHTAVVHLKSGKEIIVPCDDVLVTKDGNTLTSLKFKGSEIGSIFYLNINDISAITVK